MKYFIQWWSWEANIAVTQLTKGRHNRWCRSWLLDEAGSWQEERGNSSEWEDSAALAFIVATASSTLGSGKQRQLTRQVVQFPEHQVQKQIHRRKNQYRMENLKHLSKNQKDSPTELICLRSLNLPEEKKRTYLLTDQLRSVILVFRCAICRPEEKKEEGKSKRLVLKHAQIQLQIHG